MRDRRNSVSIWIVTPFKYYHQLKFKQLNQPWSLKLQLLASKAKVQNHCSFYKLETAVPHFSQVDELLEWRKGNRLFSKETNSSLYADKNLPVSRGGGPLFQVGRKKIHNCLTYWSGHVVRVTWTLLVFLYVQDMSRKEGIESFAFKIFFYYSFRFRQRSFN